MRDVFEDIFSNQPLDPTEAARASLRPKLRERFFTEAAVGEAGDGGHPVLLDGKPIRTPGRRNLAAPKKELAASIASEWHALEKYIDPLRMPLTRLSNSIIDGVSGAEASGDAFIAEQQKKRQPAKAADSFDQAVQSTLRTQIKR